jgi:glycosyltransferase involved in cell wall biosynthesis
LEQMTAQRFPGRVGMIERVLTPFRVPVVDALAQACAGGVSVTTGEPAPGETLAAASPEALRHAKAAWVHNRHYFSGSNNRFYFCWQRGLIPWLEQWNPDALIVDANPRFLSTRRAVRWMHRRNRPVMGWGLGVMPLSHGLEWMRRIGRRRFVNMFDGMFAYSTRAAEQYAALGMPRDRIFVCKNAATFRPTRPLSLRPRNLTDPPVILFVGKLIDAKRVDLLLQACAAIQDQFKPKLRIVGEGPALEGLKTMSKSLEVDAEFLGSRYGQELDVIFDSADLFVLPGLGGLATQEAMAHGLPVIVAEADGTQADLVRPENGWNIAAGDVAELAAALRAALQDPAKLRDMGAASYRIVAEEINIEKMVEVFVAGLQHVRAVGVRG